MYKNKRGGPIIVQCHAASHQPWSVDRIPGGFKVAWCQRTSARLRLLAWDKRRRQHRRGSYWGWS